MTPSAPAVHRTFELSTAFERVHTKHLCLCCQDVPSKSFELTLGWMGMRIESPPMVLWRPVSSTSHGKQLTCFPRLVEVHRTRFELPAASRLNGIVPPTWAPRRSDSFSTLSPPPHPRQVSRAFCEPRSDARCVAVSSLLALRFLRVMTPQEFLDRRRGIDSGW